jgi:hypothetical protein
VTLITIAVQWVPVRARVVALPAGANSFSILIIPLGGEKGFVMLSRRARAVAAPAALLSGMLIAPVAALAAPVVFQAVDVGTGPGGPFPTVSAAVAAFQSAANAAGGPINTIDFDSLPPGYASSIAIGAGVTADFTNADSVSYGSGVRGVVFDPQFGYPVSGSQFLGFRPAGGGAGSVTFNFAGNGVESFGVYITGAEHDDGGPMSVVYSDGTTHTINLSDIGPFTGFGSGNLQFFGLVADGASITSVTFNGSGSDSIGFDNLMYTAGNAPAGPGNGGAAAPLPLAVWSALPLAAGVIVRRRRRGAAA